MAPRSSDPNQDRRDGGDRDLRENTSERAWTKHRIPRLSGRGIFLKPPGGLRQFAEEDRPSRCGGYSLEKDEREEVVTNDLLGLAYLFWRGHSGGRR